MKPVESRSIAAVGHDPGRRVLSIRFKSGETYHYQDVGEHHHAALIGAQSIGAHFQKHIRNRFKGTKA